MSALLHYHDSVVTSAPANTAMTSTARTTTSTSPPPNRGIPYSALDTQLPRSSSKASSRASNRARADIRSDDDTPDEITAMIPNDRLQRSYNTVPAAASITTSGKLSPRSPPASLGGRKRKAGRIHRAGEGSAPTTTRTDAEGSPGRWQRFKEKYGSIELDNNCLLYTSPSPRDRTRSRMPSSA